MSGGGKDGAKAILPHCLREKSYSFPPYPAGPGIISESLMGAPGSCSLPERKVHRGKKSRGAPTCRHYGSTKGPLPCPNSSQAQCPEQCILSQSSHWSRGRSLNTRGGGVPRPGSQPGKSLLAANWCGVSNPRCLTALLSQRSGLLFAWVLQVCRPAIASLRYDSASRAFHPALMRSGSGTEMENGG